MNTPVLSINGIYIQQTFPRQSDLCIRRKYWVENEETLLAAVWCGAFMRYGFVFTDKAMYWRCDSEESRRFYIPKAEGERLTAIVEGCTGSVAHIQFECGSERDDLFVSRIDSEKAQALVTLIAALFNGEDFLLEDFAPHVGQFPLSDVRACADAVQNVFSALNEKIDSLQKKLNESMDSARVERERLRAEQSGAGETAAEKSDQDSQAKPESGQETERKKSAGEKVSYGILCVLDVLASLVFVAMVILVLKPQLFSSMAGIPYEENDLSGSVHLIQRIGDYVISFDSSIYPTVSEKLVPHFRFIVGLALVIFTVLKILVLCFSKNGVRKIISVLLLAMTVLSCFLLHEKFILFLLFCLLLYISFEFSCGLKAKRVFARLLSVLLLGIVLYYALHLALDPALVELLKSAHAKVRFPAVKWW